MAADYLDAHALWPRKEVTLGTAPQVRDIWHGLLQKMGVSAGIAALQAGGCSALGSGASPCGAYARSWPQVVGMALKWF